MLQKEVLLLQCSQRTHEPLVQALAEAGWTVRTAVNPDQALAIQTAHDCPVGIACMDTATFVPERELRRIAGRRHMEWVAVVPREAISDPRDAQLIAATFHDFHTMPVDFDRLLVVLGHALGKCELLRHGATGDASATGRYGMVGRSPKLMELYHALDKVVRVDAPVLIAGESGTGKELVARAIHQHSSRGRGPFVVVNCGALPTSLAQAELFGHEKGSFTGAHQRRVGSIESADGGTVFLDEIGDLPVESQASLLRFLQEKTIVRVGSARPIRVDARVVAATYVDLTDAVRRGRFRDDLLYRLNVLHLQVPPLRERPGDIPLLAQWVLQTHRADRTAGPVAFSPRALAAMQAHRWPGNVRELINRVHKALIMCEGAAIEPADLGLAPANDAGPCASLAVARATTQRDLIRQTLDQHEFNVAATARALGVSRVTLYRLMNRLEITRGPPANGHRDGASDPH
jgi:DNA-binding NtrC family response regulator